MKLLSVIYNYLALPSPSMSIIVFSLAPCISLFLRSLKHIVAYLFSFLAAVLPVLATQKPSSVLWCSSAFLYFHWRKIQVFTDGSLQTYTHILLLWIFKGLCLNPVHGNLCCLTCKDHAIVTVWEKLQWRCLCQQVYPPFPKQITTSISCTSKNSNTPLLPVLCPGRLLSAEIYLLGPTLVGALLLILWWNAVIPVCSPLQPWTLLCSQT